MLVIYSSHSHILTLQINCCLWSGCADTLVEWKCIQSQWPYLGYGHCLKLLEHSKLEFKLCSRAELFISFFCSEKVPRKPINIFSFRKRQCQMLPCQLCDCVPVLDENNLWFKAISVWAFVVSSALIKTKTFEANLQKISYRTK